MDIKTTTGLVGFLVALSAFNISDAQAASQPSHLEGTPTIEERLTNLNIALKAKERQIQTTEGGLPQSADGEVYAGAWRNGGGGGAWRNGGGGGWRNGWRDGGGFANWRD